MTDTHRELCWMTKKLAPAALHVLLSILVVTSPAPDVWLSILTDYTYDSELDIADGVPLAFDAARCSRRGIQSSVMKLKMAQVKLNLA